MKYKRLTKRIADGEEAFLFHSSLHEGIERLAELEDKIESGELIMAKERDEYKHRAARAERALQIADELGELCGRKEDYVQQAEKELEEEGKDG